MAPQVKVRSHVAAVAATKCFATAAAAQNGIGTHLLVAPCGTTATTAAASAHMNESISYNGIQLIVAPLPQLLPLHVNEP